MISKKIISVFLDKIQVQFEQCFNALLVFKHPDNRTEKDIKQLTLFQENMATALFKLERCRSEILKKQKEIISKKNNTKWQMVS